MPGFPLSVPFSPPHHVLASGLRLRFDTGMHFRALIFLTLLLFSLSRHTAAEENPPRCELLPLPDHQVSFLHEGRQVTRWHFGPQYPRPFFYPFNGPSGESLTRMGHPGAQNHDHHRSVWFAHAKLEGIDFWSENTSARIRQKLWFGYEDGGEESLMGVLLGWVDGEGVELAEQEVVTASRPGDDGEHSLEIQILMRPGAGRESTTLEKSNFGLLAVRVAKSLSQHFGGGQLTSSEGATGEQAIFGNPASWVDYSGPIATGKGGDRHYADEGITFFDHPANPRFPTRWHVREDGWMGASFCFEEPWTFTRDQPLVLRYLLHAHGGKVDPDKASRMESDFAKRPGFLVEKSSRPHRQFEVRRADE